jgi:hypothetical protein
MNGLDLRNARRTALLAALVGLALSLVGLFVAPRQLLAGWWTAAVFVLGFPVGAMTVLMIHMLTGGRWGDAVGDPLRALTALMPLAFLLLLPLLAGLGSAFPWAAEAADALPETVRLKLAYLNLPFFLLRFGVTAIIWLFLCWMVLRLSDPAAPDNPAASRRRSKWCAVGLILNGLAITVFSTDWMLALEPRFYSTIYAFLEASGEVCGAYALALLVYVLSLGAHVPEGGKQDVLVTEDMSNMLFGFVMMWVYLAFMQYLIVWAGDLPDEIHWYILRGRHGWHYILWALIALEAVLPMAAFLSRGLKRSRSGVIAVAGAVLAGHFLDMLWRIRPAFDGTALSGIWIDAGAFLATGGLAVAAATFLPLGRPLEGRAHG